MYHLALSQTDTRRVIGVLQQWQVLLSPGEATAAAVTLADVQAALLSLQQAFGPTATLETIIQTLVGQDLREQLNRRRARAEPFCAVA